LSTTVGRALRRSHPDPDRCPAGAVPDARLASARQQPHDPADPPRRGV